MIAGSRTEGCRAMNGESYRVNHAAVYSTLTAPCRCGSKSSGQRHDQVEFSGGAGELGISLLQPQTQRADGHPRSSCTHLLQIACHSEKEPAAPSCCSHSRAPLLTRVSGQEEDRSTAKKIGP